MDWLPTISLAAHTFAVSMLFICIFAAIPWLNWYDYYNYRCRTYLTPRSQGRDPCASENPYKCNACLVVAYIFILIAFIVLLARLIVWISPIRFKYKTPAIGILIDFLLILWVLIIAILATVGGTRLGDNFYVRDFAMANDILFSMKIAAWFAFAAISIAFIVDYIYLRRNKRIQKDTNHSQSTQQPVTSTIHHTSPPAMHQVHHHTSPPVIHQVHQPHLDMPSALEQTEHHQIISTRYQPQVTPKVHQVISLTTQKTDDKHFSSTHHHHSHDDKHSSHDYNHDGCTLCKENCPKCRNSTAQKRSKHRQHSFSTSSEEERLEPISLPKARIPHRSDDQTPSPITKEGSKQGRQIEATTARRTSDRLKNGAGDDEVAKRRPSSPIPDISLYSMPPGNIGNESDSSHNRKG